MRRLPSEPDYLRDKRIRSKLNKIKRRRVKIAVIELSIIAITLMVLFIKTSPLIEEFKYKTNGIDCEISNFDFEFGAGVYFECGDSNALIDSGSEGHSDELLRFIKSEEINKLDYLLISDVNTEYIETLGELLKIIEITKIIIPECDDSLYAIYDELLLANGKSLSSAKSIPCFPVNEMKFQIIDSETMTYKIIFGNNSFLIGNFSDENREIEIINSMPYIDSDVLISLNGNLPCDKFLETVSPKKFVINCDESDNVNLSSAEKLSDGIYRTDLNGDITIKSNEVDLKIECEKQ